MRPIAPLAGKAGADKVMSSKGLDIQLWKNISFKTSYNRFAVAMYSNAERVPVGRSSHDGNSGGWDISMSVIV